MCFCWARWRPSGGPPFSAPRPRRSETSVHIVYPIAIPTHTPTMNVITTRNSDYATQLFCAGLPKTQSIYFVVDRNCAREAISGLVPRRSFGTTARRGRRRGRQSKPSGNSCYPGDRSRSLSTSVRNSSIEASSFNQDRLAPLPSERCAVSSLGYSHNSIG